MLIGVEGEWVFNPQADDGTVTNLPGFAMLLLTATIGFALLLLAVRGLRAQASATKAARVGALMSLVGAGLLVAFGMTGLITSVLNGSPLEASFIAFILVACRCQVLTCFVGRLVAGRSFPSARQDVHHAFAEEAPGVVDRG